MSLCKRLWQDESGVVLSAEAVLVGTVGVLGAVVGLSTVSNAVDAELKEVGFAIRSLDQSYGYYGHQSCNAWTAGSYYIQPKIEDSMVDLGTRSEADAAAIRDRVNGVRERLEKQTAPAPRIDERTPAPLPNDLPQPEPAETNKAPTPL